MPPLAPLETPEEDFELLLDLVELLPELIVLPDELDDELLELAAGLLVLLDDAEVEPVELLGLEALVEPEFALPDDGLFELAVGAVLLEPEAAAPLAGLLPLVDVPKLPVRFVVLGAAGFGVVVFAAGVLVAGRFGVETAPWLATTPLLPEFGTDAPLDVKA